MMDKEEEPKRVRLPDRSGPPTEDDLKKMAAAARNQPDFDIELKWTLPGAKLPFELVVRCTKDNPQLGWKFSEVDGRARDVFWNEYSEDLPGVCGVIEKLSAALGHAGQAPQPVAAPAPMPAATETEYELPDDDDFDAEPDDELANEVNGENLEFLGDTAGTVKVLSEQMINAGTGMLSFSCLFKFLEHEANRYRAHRTPVSLILFDIRQSNSSPLPVSALATVALRIGMITRNTDLVGHFEGDDIAMVLPATDRTTAVFLANKVLQTLTAGPLAAGLGRNSLQFAVGISSLPDDANTLEGLIEAGRKSKERARQRAMA